MAEPKTAPAAQASGMERSTDNIFFSSSGFTCAFHLD